MGEFEKWWNTTNSIHEHMDDWRVKDECKAAFEAGIAQQAERIKELEEANERGACIVSDYQKLLDSLKREVETYRELTQTNASIGIKEYERAERYKAALERIRNGIFCGTGAWVKNVAQEALKCG